MTTLALVVVIGVATVRSVRPDPALTIKATGFAAFLTGPAILWIATSFA